MDITALRNAIVGLLLDIKVSNRPCVAARAVSGHVAAAPPKSVMNSRRAMPYPKLRRRHITGSNEHFDRGLKQASKKPLPQRTAIIAVGSLADKTSLAEIKICPSLLQ